jgi:magnesium chelatase family protein
MNPCPCGYYGDPRRECRCSQTQIQSYRNRISGPLLDRIDIHMEVPAVRYQDISSTRQGESSAVIRARVAATRGIQLERFKDSSHTTCNAAMSSRETQRHCTLDPEAQNMLKLAMTDMNFSARAYDRVIKVARTIADMDHQPGIGVHHVTEAIQYRSLDRLMWV